MLGLKASKLRVDVHQMRARGVIDEQRRLHQLRSGFRQTPPLVLVEITGAEFLLVHARPGADHARQQRFARHFERENCDRLFLVRMHGHVLSHVQRQRRLPNGRPRGKNHQLAAVQPAGHFIELQKSRADALDALAGIEKRVDAALEVVDDRLRIDQRVLRACIAELQQCLFGAGQDLVGLLFADNASIDQLLRSKDDAAQRRFVLDDAYVALQVGKRGKAFVERDQVADAVDRLELVLLQQLVRDRDAIDALRACIQLAHAQKDAAVLFQAEVVGIQRAGYLDIQRIVHQNRAKDKALGVEINRESFFQRDVGSCSHKTQPFYVSGDASRSQRELLFSEAYGLASGKRCGKAVERGEELGRSKPWR